MQEASPIGYDVQCGTKVIYYLNKLLLIHVNAHCPIYKASDRVNEPL